MSVRRSLLGLVTFALLIGLAVNAEAQSSKRRTRFGSKPTEDSLHFDRSLVRYPKPLFPQSSNQRESPQPLFPPAAPTLTTPTITKDALPELEYQIFEYVNEYRRQRGLRSLRIDDRISDHARAHSQAMASHAIPFGHTDFKRRVRQVDRIISSRRVSENVAYIFSHNDPAKRAFEGWLKSPTHRRAIEDNFSITGIGVAIGDRGALYFTQIYLRPR
jgi:uncharacterized protein YkwD